jgi:hypothetical protein
MKIEELVPPLEICKKIPAGEFAGSVLCWIDTAHSGVLPDLVVPPKQHPFVELRRYTIQGDEIPAPTLQEIMSTMSHCRVYKKTNGCFIAVHEKIRITHMDGATAALKLWFKNKGIEE